MKKRSALRSDRGTLLASLVLVSAFLPVGCTSPPPADPYCSYTPLRTGADVKSGQGALEADGTTDAYFYVVDANGKQIGYASLGKALGLDPGPYQLKVNESPHPVTVAKGMLTKCATGTLKVSGATPEYYYVFDATGRQLHYEMLGKTASLMPGSYRVKLNNAEAPAEVKPDHATELQSGSLIVHGGTDEYYYVFEPQGKQLAYNHLEKSLAFFPGSYSIKLNNSEAKADIAAERLTELKSGTLLVKGSTEDYYYVLDSVGKQLGYQGLNKSMAFFPGSFRVQVNKSEATAELASSQVLELETGSLTASATGAEFFYVFDKTGGQLGYSAVNKPLAFFPGTYSVKVGQGTRSAAVTAGRTAEIKF